MLSKKSVITITMLMSLGLGAPAVAQCPGGNVPGKYTPEQLAEATRNCPGLNGQLGPETQIAATADARMRKIAKALEGNKRTSDSLIRAAAEAGVEPHVLDDMKQLSQAFREMFMAAVPPQQLLESLLSGSGNGENQGGIIITAPDGSQWLITPQGRSDAPTPPKGRPPKMGKGHRPAPEVGSAPNPHSGLLPPAKALQDPSLKVTPPAPAQSETQQMDAAPGERIIYNETLPYWPTKQHLGKEGILKYLEKYRDAQ